MKYAIEPSAIAIPVLRRGVNKATYSPQPSVAAAAVSLQSNTSTTITRLVRQRPVTPVAIITANRGIMLQVHWKP